jgi:hypothetical protein
MTYNGFVKEGIPMLRAFSLFALLIASTAFAGLGQDQTSVETDRRTFSGGKTQITSFSGYSVHQFASSGLTVLEYSLPNGTVFAVTWKGISHPDLTSLLGSYLKDYQAALKSTPRQIAGRRRFGVVQGKEVTVERGGHMRAVRGRAYVTSMFPQGVTANDIK